MKHGKTNEIYNCVSSILIIARRVLLELLYLEFLNTTDTKVMRSIVTK